MVKSVWEAYEQGSTITTVEHQYAPTYGVHDVNPLLRLALNELSANEVLGVRAGRAGALPLLRNLLCLGPRGRAQPTECRARSSGRCHRTHAAQLDGQRELSGRHVEMSASSSSSSEPALCKPRSWVNAGKLVRRGIYVFRRASGASRRRAPGWALTRGAWGTRWSCGVPQGATARRPPRLIRHARPALSPARSARDLLTALIYSYQSTTLGHALPANSGLPHHHRLSACAQAASRCASLCIE